MNNISDNIPAGLDMRVVESGYVSVVENAADVHATYSFALSKDKLYVKPSSSETIPKSNEIVMFPGGSLTGELSLNADDFYIEAPVTSTLSDIEEYLMQSDSPLYLPIICYNNGLHIGSIVATNAANFLAPIYGDIARLVMGVVAIRPNGDIIDTGRRSIKGVAGYNLSNAFIGSRGSEGLICRLRFRLFPCPPLRIIYQIGGEMVDWESNARVNYVVPFIYDKLNCIYLEGSPARLKSVCEKLAGELNNNDIFIEIVRDDEAINIIKSVAKNEYETR